MGKLAQIQDRLVSYARMLDTIAEGKLRTAICTIYEPRFPTAHVVVEPLSLCPSSMT